VPVSKNAAPKNREEPPSHHFSTPEGGFHHTNAKKEKREGPLKRGTRASPEKPFGKGNAPRSQEDPQRYTRHPGKSLGRLKTPRCPEKIRKSLRNSLPGKTSGE